LIHFQMTRFAVRCTSNDGGVLMQCGGCAASNRPPRSPRPRRANSRESILPTGQPPHHCASTICGERLGYRRRRQRRKRPAISRWNQLVRRTTSHRRAIPRTDRADGRHARHKLADSHS
jgi:hypothetical protein